MLPAFIIAIETSEEASRNLVDEVVRRHGRVLRIDVAGVRDLADLEQALIRLFEIPYPSVGWDSIIDFGSSLDEWMDPAGGFLFLVAGLDGAPIDVCATVARILPNMIDRWRSGETIEYRALLVSNTSRPTVLPALSSANGRLREHGRFPSLATFVGPVPVYLDGVLDQEVSAGAPMEL